MTEFDINSLTIGEAEAIEELCGVPIDALFAEGKPKGKALRAIVFTMRRRTDPEFTWEQAGEVRFTDVDLGGEPTPTDAAGSGS